MQPDELQEFELAARRIFGRLAAELGAELLPFNSGYEMCSGIACIRIRPGIGHVADVLGTIVPVEHKSLPLEMNSHEIGLRVAAEFLDSEIVTREANSIYEQVEREAEYARASRSLFESETHWSELVQSILDRTANATAAMRERFPEMS